MNPQIINKESTVDNEGNIWVNESSGEIVKKLVKSQFIEFPLVEYPKYFINPPTLSKDLIYACSYIDVLFDYPHQNQVSFRIQSDNGKFTECELIDKIMKYYRFTIFMNDCYDFDKGVIGNGTKMFNLIDSAENGITGIEFNKKESIWKVIMKNYI